MADGGAINLRMSLQGAEQARKELESLGPAGAKMAREIERAMRQPTAGMKAFDTGMKEARTSVEGFGARAGPVGTILQSFGGWGLAAAAGVAAFAATAASAVRISNDAVRAAEAITDTADRIGIGTEALQQWRYVADEAGVPVSALESDLEKLNGTLGKFKMGIGDAKLKPWFQELGISQTDLDSIRTADQLMILLADRLGQITDRSKQVAAARAFGIEASLPALRLGSDSLQDLLERSKELGVVMDAELVAKLDAAGRKSELAGQQLKTLAFGAVEPLATTLANAGAWIGNMSVEFDKVESKAPSWIRWLLAIQKAIPGTGAAFQLGELGVGRALSGKLGSGFDPDHTAGDVPSVAAMRAFATGGTGGFDPRGHTGGGSSGPSAEARERERKRKEAEREIERIRKEEIDAGREYLRDVMARRDSEAERAEAAKLLAESERAEEVWRAHEMAERIKAAGLWNDEIAARMENIQGIRDQVREDKERQRVKQEVRDREEAVLAAERAYEDIQGEILALASVSARTSSERRTIELQLLDIAQRRMRQDLERLLADAQNDEDRARYEEALGRLPALFDAQRARVSQDNAGPLASWWNAQRKTPEAEEWVQGQAIDAIDGVNRGLIDAWRNAESAGDALDRMGKVGVDALRQIEAALLEVAIQQMFIKPLVNSLFGDGKGSGGGFLGNLIGNILGAGSSAAGKSATLSGKVAALPGKARGGLVSSAGLHRLGEFGMEVADMPVGARIYDTDRTERMLRDRLESAGGSQVVQPIVNMPVKVINNGREPMTATTRQTPEGLEVILDPLVRKAVGGMGADGSLEKARLQTPRGIDR